MLSRFLQARNDPARPLTLMTCPRPTRCSGGQTLCFSHFTSWEDRGLRKGGLPGGRGAKGCSSRGGERGRGGGESNEARDSLVGRPGGPSLPQLPRVLRSSCLTPTLGTGLQLERARLRRRGLLSGHADKLGGRVFGLEREPVLRPGRGPWTPAAVGPVFRVGVPPSLRARGPLGRRRGRAAGSVGCHAAPWGA